MSIKLHSRACLTKNIVRDTISTLLPVLYDDLWSLAGHSATVVILVPLIGKRFQCRLEGSWSKDRARRIHVSDRILTNERGKHESTNVAHISFYGRK